jgi:arsenite/tail-anchored protein-transporting ATPase
LVALAVGDRGGAWIYSERGAMAKRILLFTGKGGVGKTTCAAATALRAAEMGYRTLVLSSDPAHSLADALDRKLGPEPEEIVPNLWAQEVDLYYSMKKYWGNMRQLMLAVFKWQGVDQIAAEEMAALPGMNEGTVLLWLEQFYRSKEFDLIVVDSAPTGETLTLLTLPQVTEWWVSKAFPFQKTAFKMGGLALRKTTGIPLDKGYEELTKLFEKLQAIRDVLANADISSVRLVANPEKMVIEEARRAYTYLQLYGYGVDAVVVNRVLPKEGLGEVFGKYLEAQERYLGEIEGSFAPLPILHVPHRGEEVFGLDLLRRIGEELYGERDPTGLYFEGQTYRVEAAGKDYVLELRLPFAEVADVSAHHAGDQLVLQINNQRRNYLLPKFLAYYTLVDARPERGWLRVRFTQPRR